MISFLIHVLIVTMWVIAGTFSIGMTIAFYKDKKYGFCGLCFMNSIVVITNTICVLVSHFNF